MPIQIFLSSIYLTKVKYVDYLFQINNDNKGYTKNVDKKKKLIVKQVC